LNAKTNKWGKDTKKISPLASKMFADLKVSDINEYNKEIIGFLTNNKRKTAIIFKTKSLASKSKETGSECPSKGENRSFTLARNNKLAKLLGKKRDKYKMKKDSKRQEESVYGKKVLQYAEDSRTSIPITDYQLCVETELILRHLDENKKNNKRWFFSTIEDVLNSIKEKHIN
jgi:hypothetical protein